MGGMFWCNVCMLFSAVWHVTSVNVRFEIGTVDGEGVGVRVLLIWSRQGKVLICINTYSIVYLLIKA